MSKLTCVCPSPTTYVNRAIFGFLASKKFVGQFEGKKEEDLTETQKASSVWQMLKSHKEKGVYEEMHDLYADIWAIFAGSIDTTSAAFSSPSLSLSLSKCPHALFSVFILCATLRPKKKRGFCVVDRPIERVWV